MFCTDWKISVRINLPLFSTVLPSNSRLFPSFKPFVVITTFSTPTRPVENVITTKGLQVRNNLLLDGKTVENKGKLILTEIFQSVQNMVFFSIIFGALFFLWLRHVDTKKTGAEVFGKLGNVVLEENWEGNMVRETNEVWTSRREEGASKQYLV